MRRGAGPRVAPATLSGVLRVSASGNASGVWAWLFLAVLVSRKLVRGSVVVVDVHEKRC
jgi:hypothetical protein